MYYLSFQEMTAVLLHTINSLYKELLSFFKKQYILRDCKKDVTRENMRFIFAACLPLIILAQSAQAQVTKFYYPNGVVSSEGTMVNGQPDGYWKTFYEDGGLKTEGNRKNFLLDSVWTFYRTDSTLERKISYSENIKNGLEQIFDEKGNIKEQFTYKNNIKDGEARTFYPTGELHMIIPFVNNKEEGKGKEFAEDGRIISNITYRNGFIYAEEKINRYNSAGNRTGIWIDLHPNGKPKEEGNWTNNLRNGVFKFFNKKGELEKMEKYENGWLVTNDNETSIIDIRKEFHANGRVAVEGSYSNGKKHGTFRMYDENGNQVSAAVYDNEILLGEGMIDSIGLRQGPWKLFYPDGKIRAEGEYKNGLKEGAWTYFFGNGKTEQKGSYKEDLPVGAWKWFYTSGASHREELYRRGKEDGHAIEYDSLGNVITEGDYVDGLKNGKWYLTVNDHSEEGEYVDGERHGEWIWKYPNGEKAFVGEFQNGTPIGKHKYFYANGNNKMKGSYEGGELSGKWEYFKEDGTLDLEIEYEAGLAVKINGQKIKLPEPKEEDQ